MKNSSIADIFRGKKVNSPLRQELSLGDSAARDYWLQLDFLIIWEGIL